MSVLLFSPIDADTVVPASASEPASPMAFGGTAIDTSTGFVVNTAGLFTLEDVSTDNAKLVRLEWGIKSELNSQIRYKVYADGEVIRDQTVEQVEDGYGSVVLTRAEWGAGVKLVLWCEDTDQAALVLDEKGTYLSAEVLYSAAI